MNNGDKVRIKGTDLEGRYLFWMGSHNVDVPGFNRFTLPEALIEPVHEVLDPVKIPDVANDVVTVGQYHGILSGGILAIDVPYDVQHFVFDRPNSIALICALQAIVNATPEENNG